MGDINLKSEFLAIVAIFSVLLLFLLYYYAAKHRLLRNYIVRPLLPSLSVGSIEFISYKLTGILFTGIIPFIVFALILRVPPSGMGLVVGRTFHYWYLLIILILVVALISYKMSGTRKVQEMSPELKISNWFPRHVILSVSSWLFYILGYEFLLRGVLWFLCIDAFGFWPALFINLLLYSVVHLPKGKLVAAGAIPAGIILCLLSWLTGSFIPAFIIHSFIAVLTDLFSLYHNPGIHLHIYTTGR